MSWTQGREAEDPESGGRHFAACNCENVVHPRLGTGVGQRIHLWERDSVSRPVRCSGWWAFLPQIMRD